MEKIKPSWTSIIFIILTLSLFVACFKPQMQKTTETGVYHLVKKNETVQMIATAYDVPLPKLVRMNNITDINSVREGSVIFIPSASRVKDIAAEVKNKNTETSSQAKKNKSDTVEHITKDKGVKEVKVAAEMPAAAQKKEIIKTAKAPKTDGSKIVIIGEPAVKTIQNKKVDDEKTSPQSKTSVPKDEVTKKDTKETKPSKIAVHKEPSTETNANKKSVEEKSAYQLKAVVPEKKMAAGKNKFVWPVKGEVTANFGIQPNKTFNNWIKIISDKYTKVTAAESGMVIFSSTLKNYGETIIIRHMDNYATVYTHLGKRYVKIDKNVKKGETIAALGEKDEKGNVYMNFEIRLQGKARNPLQFLP